MRRRRARSARRGGLRLPRGRARRAPRSPRRGTAALRRRCLDRQPIDGRAPGVRERSGGREPSSALGFHQPRHGGRAARPVRRLGVQLLPSRARERVELRAARVLRLQPCAVEPARALEPLERGQQRARVDLEHAARDLLDPPRDAEAVHRLKAEGLQNEHVERALDDVGVRLVHGPTLRRFILVVKMWRSLAEAAVRRLPRANHYPLPFLSSSSSGFSTVMKPCILSLTKCGTTAQMTRYSPGSDSVTFSIRSCPSPAVAGLIPRNTRRSGSSINPGGVEPGRIRPTLTSSSCLPLL